MFTGVVSECGHDELCCSRVLTVKNGAMQWGMTVRGPCGAAARHLSRASCTPGSSGCLLRLPEGNWTAVHSCPQLLSCLSVPCMHMLFPFFPLSLPAITWPSNTCSLAFLLSLCLSLSLFLSASLSPPFLLGFSV